MNLAFRKTPRLPWSWLTGGGGWHGWAVMQPAKPFFQSKTIIGAVIMLLPLVLEFYQVAATPDELAKAGTDLTQAVQGIAGLVGFGLVIYGRFKARAPIQNILGKGRP